MIFLFFFVSLVYRLSLLEPVSVACALRLTSSAYAPLISPLSLIPVVTAFKYSAAIYASRIQRKECFLSFLISVVIVYAVTVLIYSQNSNKVHYVLFPM